MHRRGEFHIVFKAQLLIPLGRGAPAAVTVGEIHHQHVDPRVFRLLEHRQAMLFIHGVEADVFPVHQNLGSIIGIGGRPLGPPVFAGTVPHIQPGDIVLLLVVESIRIRIVIHAEQDVFIRLGGGGRSGRLRSGGGWRGGGISGLSVACGPPHQQHPRRQTQGGRAKFPFPHFCLSPLLERAAAKPDILRRPRSL